MVTRDDNHTLGAGRTASFVLLVPCAVRGRSIPVWKDRFDVRFTLFFLFVGVFFEQFPFILGDDTQFRIFQRLPSRRCPLERFIQLTVAARTGDAVAGPSVNISPFAKSFAHR